MNHRTLSIRGIARLAMQEVLQRLVCFLGLMMLLSCESLKLVDVPSANQNSRVNHLVIHFTSEGFEESLTVLTEPSPNPVSAHYLVPEQNDLSYPFKSLRVHRLVEEQHRAWHAGESQWFNESSLNDRSIGIELVNRSQCRRATRDSDPLPPLVQQCRFLPYPDDQIDALIELINGILERHPEITPLNIVGHADIAPNRKVDPGPLFPWKKLHSAGIGAWYFPGDQAFYLNHLKQHPIDTTTAQQALAFVGYPIETSGTEDAASQRAVRAFQMRFRPDQYSGFLDDETIAISLALLNRYRPMLLGDLNLPTRLID